MSEVNIMDIPVNLDLLINKNKKKTPKNGKKKITSNKKPVLIKGEIKFINNPNLNMINSPTNLISPISNIDILNETKVNHKLSNKEIDILKNKIYFKKKFKFPKNKILIFLDKNQTKNNFQKYFYEIFSNHKYSKIILKKKKKFKQNNLILYSKLLNKTKSETEEDLMDQIKKPIRRASSIILFGSGLTKIPKFKREHTNHIIEIKYDDAKNAAVHARRLQYSYRIKPDNYQKKVKLIHNAIIIQKWWRCISLCNSYFLLSTKIQSVYRGFLCRCAILDSLHKINYILPFISRVNNVYFKHRVQDFFTILFNNFSLLKIYNVVRKKVIFIQQKHKDYYLRKRILEDGEKIFSKPYKKRSLYSKKVLDYDTYLKIIFLQKCIRGFLLRYNDNFIRKSAFYNHPYIYYKLKYKNDNIKFNNKCNKFHRFFQRLQVWNLKVNKKIKNEFEFFKKVLSKKELIDINEKLMNLYNNNQLLKNLVDYKFTKDYFFKWVKNSQKIKSFKTMLSLKKNQICKTQLKNLKRKSFTFQLPIILEKLDKFVKKIQLQKSFKKILKYSKSYTLKNIFHILYKNCIKENFNLFKDYYKNKKFINQINKIVCRKYFNNWNKEITNVEIFKNENKEIPRKIKALKLNKIFRNENKKKRLYDLKKFLLKWKKNTFDNIYEEKLEEFKEKNLLLIRFLHWRKNVKKISEREKFLDDIVNKVNENNLKYCINTYLRKRFNTLKMYNHIYKNYSKPMNDLKLMLFITLIEEKIFKKREYIDKSYFLTRLYQIIKSKEFYYGDKDNIEKIKQKYLIKLLKQNDIKNLKQSFQILKNIPKKNHLEKMSQIYQYYDLKKYFDIWRNQKLYKLKRVHTFTDEKNTNKLNKYLKEWLKRAQIIILKLASKKISEYVSLKKFKKTRKAFSNKMIISKLKQLSNILNMKINGKHLLRERINKYVYNKIYEYFKHKLLKKVFDIVQNNLKDHLLTWNIQSKKRKKLIIKSYNQFKELIFIRTQRIQFLKALNAIRNKNNRILKSKFSILRNNTGMNFIKIFHSNIQISFLYRNKKFVVGRKYRMLKYLINKRENLLIYNLLKISLLNWRYLIVILAIKDINDGKYGKITKYTSLFVKNRLQLGYKYISHLLFIQNKLKKRYSIGKNNY